MCNLKGVINLFDISYHICLTKPPPIELITSKYKCKAGDRTINACNNQPFHSSFVTFFYYFYFVFWPNVEEQLEH